MKLTQNSISELLTVSGKFPKYADGGYPLRYFDRIGNVLCAHCALESLIADKFTGECSEWPAKYVEPYYEGPIEHCDDCGADIESAYGDPEENEEVES